MSELKEAQEELLVEKRPEAGWHVRRLNTQPAKKIYAGVKQPGNRLGFLYQVSASSVPPRLELPEGSGFHTELETVIPGRDGEVRIILELINNHYEDVFLKLCEDVSSLLLSVASEKDAFRAFIQRLHAWQKFMRHQGQNVLSRPVLQGLYSEIILLRDEVMTRMPVESAISSWKGANALHDFVFAKGVVEVKSSTSKTGPTVEIANFDQLDESLVTKLFLAFVSLKEDDKSGLNLPDLIGEIREALSGTPSALQMFDDRLLAAGYLDSHQEFYALPAFSVPVIRYFLVHEDFPRIRSTELRDGVKSGHYLIGIEDCLNYELESSPFESVDGLIEDENDG
jgi:hypothetical protein